MEPSPRLVSVQPWASALKAFCKEASTLSTETSGEVSHGPKQLLDPLLCRGLRSEGLPSACFVSIGGLLKNGVAPQACHRTRKPARLWGHKRQNSIPALKALWSKDKASSGKTMMKSQEDEQPREWVVQGHRVSTPCLSHKQGQRAGPS